MMVSERVGRVSVRLPDQVWRPLRWALSVVLLLSFAGVLLRVVPASGATGGLVEDIKAGRTHTVLMDAEGTEVTVRWSTGPLTERSYVYRPAGFIAGTDDAARDFMATVDREAGQAGDRIRFRDFDATYGAGGLSLLVPVEYVLLTPWWWLRFAAVLAGLAVLARMLTAQKHRWASGPAWALAGLVTGVGLFGYLWAEPGHASKGGLPGSVATAPKWWRAWIAALITGAALGAVGVLVLLVGGRL